LGPVKGEIEATLYSYSLVKMQLPQDPPLHWAQSRFWGGKVAKNSWFAMLQRAGMKNGWVRGFLLAVAGFFGLAG